MKKPKPINKDPILDPTPVLPWAEDEKRIANHYLNENCGALHLAWVLDHYWGLVTQKVILPTASLIYDELLKKDYSEKNKLDIHDGEVYFIPSDNKKVFVQTTQSRDFLYIININKTKDSWNNLHIRRIYRELDQTDDWYSDKELIGNMKLALQNIDTLMEYHDDHYQFSSRPSLEAYRKIDFKIPYYPKDHMKERSNYGDFRDGGYILSYDGYLSDISTPRVEGAKYVFHDLEMQATSYLPCLASELEIKIPHLDGYGGR